MSVRRRAKHLKATLKGSPEVWPPANFMSDPAMFKGGLGHGARY